MEANTLTPEQRLPALAAWGEAMRAADDLETVCQRAAAQNPWFKPDLVSDAIQALVEDFLDQDRLRDWLSGYTLSTPDLRIGLVLAGNVPLVGFHDLLCTLAAGHRAVIKPSSKDEVLIKWAASWLTEVDPRLGGRISLVERLEDIDAVIATGSRNTSRYFDRYFSKWPHIIRKNRHGVAVIRGAESAEELTALGDDVFRYFGLGCRSVSKLYLPRGYDPARIMESFEPYSWVADHTRYRHNFEYHRSVMLLNRVEHLASDFLVFVEDEAIPSSIATLHYEFYDSEEELASIWKEQAKILQCVVGKGPGEVPFGQAQRPALGDYADGIDTMEFLTTL